MAAPVHFVADPPQIARFRRIDSSATEQMTGGTWQYEVGDRISAMHTTTGIVSNYRCTTAGLGGAGSFLPNGAASYTWGASVWTLIGSSSWGDAGTLVKVDCINYIDCNTEVCPTAMQSSFLPTGSRDVIAFIYVNPATGMPSTGRRVFQMGGGFQSGNAPVFFPLLGTGRSFHSRARLGFVGGIPGAEITGQVPEIAVIDAEGDAVSAAASFNQEDIGNPAWRGVNIRFTSVATRSTLYPIGVATKLTVVAAPNPVASVPVPSYISALHRFGVHIEHNKVSTLLGSGIYSSTPTSGLHTFNLPAAYISDNSFQQGAGMWGSVCGLARSEVVYRTGAAVTPDTDHSYQLGGLTQCTPATMRVTPFFLFQNTLTGARTLTLRFLTDSPFDNDITNLDIWADVFYPSSATNAQYSLATSENPNFGVPAATGTVLATDAAAWTYSGIFFPSAWKITIALSPQRAGFLFIRFNVASLKLSRYLLFLDPFFEIA